MYKEDKELTNLVFSANNSLQQKLSTRNTGGYYNSDQVADALGFPDNISYQDYLYRYKRQDIANRVIKFPVDYTWRDDPKVYESTTEDTAFEKAYEKMSKDIDLYSSFRKVDLLGALGQFSLLYIGFNDAQSLSFPVERATEVMFLEAVSEGRAVVLEWEESESSDRYGLPTMYQIESGGTGSGVSFTRTVHWTRVIHLAENTVESRVYGVPFLEPIYNRLLGLEKLCGGSPEMYWLGARPGYAASSKPDTILDADQENDLKTQLTEFVNNMKRWLYVESLDIKSLAPQVVTPRDHVDVQIEMISSYSGIPVRMLKGSERGELASTQDERAWLSLVQARREKIGTDLIIRPFIDRLLSVGVLPPPTDEYIVEWAPLIVMSDKEQAEIGEIKARALATYVNSPGSDMIIPPEVFMEQNLGMSKEEIELSLNLVDQDIREGENIINDEEEREE